MENKIYELLLQMQTEQKQFKNEVMNSFKDVGDNFKDVGDNFKEVEDNFKEVRNDIKQLDEKLELLTRQTSNAIIEHHSNEIAFLSDKFNRLEKDVYNLKRQ